MNIESIIERLNAIGESCVEYETSHKDAGHNYAHMVAESWHSEHDSRLINYLKEKGIDWSGLEIDEIADYVLDRFEMDSGYIFSMGNGDCLLDWFPVQEIEIQIDAEQLGVELVTDSLCESLSRQSDFYVARQDDSTILAYQTTDCVWDATISEKALRDIVAELRDSI